MAVRTPSYWKEEKYQPLVEVETLYGNKVKIPQRWLDIWEFYNQAVKTGEMSQQVYQDTLNEMIKNRGLEAADFAKVLLEIYQESR